MTDIQNRITELHGRKTEDSMAATYLDTPDLKELLSIARECGTDPESLKVSFYLYDFLSEQYESMGRFSVAAELRKDELCSAVVLMQQEVL